MAINARISVQVRDSRTITDESSTIALGLLRKQVAAQGLSRARRSRGTTSRGMADQHTRPNVAALRKLEASLQHDLRQREAQMRAPQGRGGSHAGAPHIDEAPIPRVVRPAANSNAANAAAGNAIAGNVAAARRSAAVRKATGYNERRSPHDLLNGSDYWRANVLRVWGRLRKVAYVAGGLAGLVLVAMLALWWRLGSGPIELDVATP